jgi:hypothetical protein
MCMAKPSTKVINLPKARNVPGGGAGGRGGRGGGGLGFGGGAALSADFCTATSTSSLDCECSGSRVIILNQFATGTVGVQLCELGMVEIAA